MGNNTYSLRVEGEFKDPRQMMDDIVGDLLQSQEGYDKKKADAVRKLLLTVAEKGVEYLSPADKMQMAGVALRYGINFEAAWKLYGKYIGNWGGEATVWRVDAVTGGKVVASKTYCPNTALRLEVTPSSAELHEKDSYDVAAVRIRVVDANGNTASYAQIPVKLTLEGEAELVGPDLLAAEGGMCGTYIHTTGQKGKAKLTISTPQTETVSITFTIQ